MDDESSCGNDQNSNLSTSTNTSKRIQELCAALAIKKATAAWLQATQAMINSNVQPGHNLSHVSNILQHI
jgi:hypothetical protein